MTLKLAIFSAFLLTIAGCKSDRLQGVEECRIPANHERPEICDGKDDDCDGIPDDGCDDDGDGWCETGFAVDAASGPCANGGDCDDRRAEIHPTADEVCDGSDNDCDGRVDATDDAIPDQDELKDERVGVQCGDGVTPEKDGKGPCRYGRTLCVLGSVVCVGAKSPEAEGCDGKDNDCNGLVDDGPASYETCWGRNNPLIGRCSPGFHVCRNGTFDRTRCMNEVLPSGEVCNSLDDDCDGLVDEGTAGEHLIYVLFHLDCSGSMIDKLRQISEFLDRLDTLPPVYRSSRVRFGVVLYPEMGAAQRPWVHRTYADVDALRASLSAIDTNACGALEYNLDSVAYGMCSSRPTPEWAQGHACRTLFDAEWSRCNGISPDPTVHPTGSICQSTLSAPYPDGRIYDLPVPDNAHQLHVLLTDEAAQTSHGLTASSVNVIKSDLRGKYAASNWNALIRVACFVSDAYAPDFLLMCDRTYSLSANTTSTQMMTDFTAELQDLSCK